MQDLKLYVYIKCSNDYVNDITLTENSRNPNFSNPDARQILPYHIPFNFFIG